MQISISARHGHLSPGTQEKITEKVDKLSRYHERVTSIQVTVDLGHKDAPSVEVRVKAEHADDFVATDDADNVLAALDGAVHKVESQLRRHREKQTEHRAAGHKHQEATTESESDAD